MENVTPLIAIGQYYLDKVQRGDETWYRVSYAEFTRGNYGDLEEACIRFYQECRKSKNIRSL